MKRKIIFSTALLVIGFLFFILFPSHQSITILTRNDKHQLRVEVMKTEEEKERGLMGRKNLSSDAGMLFVYPNDSHPVMWMKNMLIPLDMAFVGDNGIISHIEKNIPPCKAKDDRECPLYQAKMPSALVLELPAGYCSEKKVGVGDRIIIP